MRALLLKEYGQPENCQFCEVPDLKPSLGEVLIQVSAAGISYVDLLVISGQYQIKPPVPFSPGKEVAGDVVSIGEDVTSIKQGDRVLALVEYGAVADQVCVPQEQCFVMPDKMSFEAASGFGLSYQTAYFALHDRARLKNNDVIFTTGAGSGVGLAVVELSKAYGATVLAGLTNLSKIGVTKAAGADAIIDLSKPDLRNSLREQIYAQTDGKGADVIVDMIGGDVFDSSLRALAWRGRIVVVGFASGRIPSMKTNYLLLKNIEVSGLDWSDYRGRDPEWVLEVQSKLFNLYELGRINTHVYHTIPIEKFLEAVKLIQQRSFTGRIALTFS